VLDPHVRRALRLLAVGGLMVFTGNGISAFYVLALQQNPTVSWADPFYLADSLLTLFALLSFPLARRTRLERWKFVLDAAMVLVGGGVAIWYFSVRPTAASHESTVVVTLLAFAYPLVSMLVLLGVTTVLLRRATETPKPRKKTRPTYASKLRRLQGKVGLPVQLIAQRSRRDQPGARDGVRAQADRDALVMENAGDWFISRAFGRIGQADAAALRCQARHAHHDAGLEQALGIEHEVIALGLQLPPECPDLGARGRREQGLAPAPQGDRDDLADVGIEADQAGVALFDRPVDLSRGEMTMDVRHHRHVVDDVSQRGDTDDKNVQG